MVFTRDVQWPDYADDYEVKFAFYPLHILYVASFLITILHESTFYIFGVCKMNWRHLIPHFNIKVKGWIVTKNVFIKKLLVIYFTTFLGFEASYDFLYFSLSSFARKDFLA